MAFTTTGASCSCSRTRTMATKSHSPVTEYASATPSTAASSAPSVGIAERSASISTTAWVTIGRSRCVSLTRRHHDALRVGGALHLGLERLRVGLDGRERPVVARDHLSRPDHARGLDAVMAVHRVMPADAHQGDIDAVPAADQLEVAEERGVAEGG